MKSVVTSSLRRVLGNESLLNVLSAERSRIMGLIRDQVAGEMKAFGVTIEDVRLRRADLPPENTQAILRAMAWLGLDYDEGPAVGGEYGPYLQTLRFERYAEGLEMLKASGNAYACFIRLRITEDFVG